MKPEQPSNEQDQNQPARLSRLFNAVASFGVFYTVLDIAATYGNDIYAASHHIDIGDLTPNNISVMSAIGAAVGSLIMDRSFQHHNRIQQPEQTESPPTSEDPSAES